MRTFLNTLMTRKIESIFTIFNDNYESNLKYLKKYFHKSTLKMMDINNMSTDEVNNLANILKYKMEI